MRTSSLRATVVAAVAALGLAACAAPSIPADSPAFTGTPAAAPTPLASQACTNPTQSYEPSSVSAFPAGSLQKQLRDSPNRKFVVGVSGDSLLLGSRDPERPNEFSGFDIDLARAVAKAIYPTDWEKRIQFRVITAAQRIPLVNKGGADGGVDMVARNMTMNCDRWKQVSFSAVYFLAEQKVLVRNDSGVDAVADLAASKARVCAPAGSTSIQRMVDSKYAGIVPVQVDQHTTCLALLQEGRVDAITGDSTVLAGLKVQDPGTRVLGGPALGQEPYGLAVGQSQKQFAQFVNAVLVQYIASGQWTAAYDKYFGSADLGPGKPPTPEYGR